MDDLKGELKRLRKAKDDIQAEMVVALKVNSIFFCIFMTFYDFIVKDFSPSLSDFKTKF